MCLTVPAKVIAVGKPVNGAAASEITVEDSRGVRALKNLLLPDLKPGDWVLSAYDAAVRKISSDDALEIIRLLEPRSHIDISLLDPAFLEILKKSSTMELSRDEIIRLIETEDPLETETLFAEANTVRQAHLKDFFCIHGIIELSNHCVRDCFYCGLRRSGAIRRYRMMPYEITEVAVDAVKRRGYKLLVLQSGDDFGYTDEDLENIVRRIKKSCRVFIFMSVGERSLECYARMKRAGASGSLFRFETSSPSIYRSIHPGQSYERRMELLEGMKGLGYYIASGFLIGLPGQTIGDIADDILAMKRLKVNMASVGPFIPSTATPLAALPAGSPMMTLRVIAVLRLLMPTSKIPVTTALETIEREEGRRLALSSGANSLMFNLTPERYRADYRIYPDKYNGNIEVWEKYGLFNEELSYRMLEKKMFSAFEEK